MKINYNIIDTLYDDYVNHIYKIHRLYDNLYKDYIKYVFYKYKDTIIIMEIIDNIKCISDKYVFNYQDTYYPYKNNDKYYSDNLKVILMFNQTDPYKLVFQIENTKYKINDNIASHCYLTIYHLQNVNQMFYINGQVARETTSFGLNQEYYDNGQLRNEYYCEYGSINGLYTQYHENGQLMYQCNYYQGYINDYYIEYHDNGYIHIECEYIKGNKHGLYRKYHNNGNIHIECIYELDKIKN